MTDKNWVTVESPPQLSLEDVERLTPQQVQQALGNGQLSDALKPSPPDEDREVPPHLAKMLKEMGL